VKNITIRRRAIAAAPNLPYTVANMKDGTREILNDPNLIAIRDRGLARLEAQFAGTLGEVFHMHGVAPMVTRVDIDPIAWLDDTLDYLADCGRKILAHGEADSIFRPLGLIYNPREVHFVDHLFGADVVNIGTAEEPNWQVNYMTHPVGELAPVDLTAQPDWQLTMEVAHAFVARDVKAVHFSMPTIASALNIAMSLYGQEFLVAMLADTDAALRDLRTINDLLVELHRWFIASIPADQLQPICPDHRYQPVGYGQLCGCSAQLISAEMYAEHIAPLDDELLGLYPHGGMIHICGRHHHHIPTWRGMPNVRAIQFNWPATQYFQAYYDGLRDDQMLYLDRPDDLPLEVMLDGTDGGRRCVFASSEDDVV
jgi:hypothetical protein